MNCELRNMNNNYYLCTCKMFCTRYVCAFRIAFFLIDTDGKTKYSLGLLAPP